VCTSSTFTHSLFSLSLSLSLYLCVKRKALLNLYHLKRQSQMMSLDYHKCFFVYFNHTTRSFFSLSSILLKCRTLSTLSHIIWLEIRDQPTFSPNEFITKFIYIYFKKISLLNLLFVLKAVLSFLANSKYPHSKSYFYTQNSVELNLVLGIFVDCLIEMTLIRKF